MINARPSLAMASAFAAGVCFTLLVAAGTGTQEHAGTQRSKHWAPVEAQHLYLCAFHTAKGKPGFQIEAHHFCSPIGQIHQCTVYEGDTAGSKLLGTEYIISDEIYRKLPDGEKKYWHPHAYEILSGQLVAPDLPKEGDEAFPGLITTWGKTWHTWPDPSTDVPMGPPLLMWSAGADGQINQAQVDKRDAKFGIHTAAIRDRRKPWGYEVPTVPAPKSMDDLGRQWTASGEDKPTKKN